MVPRSSDNCTTGQRADRRTMSTEAGDLLAAALPVCPVDGRVANRGPRGSFVADVPVAEMADRAPGLLASG